jgi:hypothetical protein
MKHLFLLSRGFLTIAFGILPQFVIGGGMPNTNALATGSADVHILMKFSGKIDDRASNKPSAIFVTITNNSLYDVYLGWPTVGAPVWFRVTLPSGKDVSTPEPGAQKMGSATTTPILRAHEASDFTFQLNNICPLTEAGTYRYSANVRVFCANTNFVVTSSPVEVSLSEADIDTLRRSSGGFLK